VRRAEWAAHFDVDPQRARATRRAFLVRHADRPVLVLGTHFAATTGGWIVSAGDAWEFSVEERAGAGRPDAGGLR
jgi:hypothetical protein